MLLASRGKFNLKTRDFSDDTEVAELVSAFETAAIPAAEFTHVAHIAVALSYLNDFTPDEALARMRGNIRAFAAHHGVPNLYHETLTTFWMKVLDHVAANVAVEVPLWRRINLIVEQWGNRGAVDAHYTPEVVKSQTAREKWIPPDRLPLPF